MTGRLWVDYFNNIILPWANPKIDKGEKVMIFFDSCPSHNNFSFRESWTKK